MSDLLEKTLKKFKISELKALIKNRKYKIKLTQKKQDLINDICTHVTSLKSKQKTKVKGGMFNVKKKIDIFEPPKKIKKYLYGPCIGFIIKISNFKIIFLGEHHDYGNPLKKVSGALGDDITLEYFFKDIIKKYGKCFLFGELNIFPHTKFIDSNLKKFDSEERSDLSSGYEKNISQKLISVAKQIKGPAQDSIKDIHNVKERVLAYYESIREPFKNKKYNEMFLKNSQEYKNKNIDLNKLVTDKIDTLIKNNQQPELKIILANFKQKIDKDIKELIQIVDIINIQKHVRQYFHICSYLTDLKTLEQLSLCMKNNSDLQLNNVAIIYNGAMHTKTFFEICNKIEKLWINMPEGYSDKLLLDDSFFKIIDNHITNTAMGDAYSTSDSLTLQEFKK